MTLPPQARDFMGSGPSQSVIAPVLLSETSREELVPDPVTSQGSEPSGTEAGGHYEHKCK